MTPQKQMPPSGGQGGMHGLHRTAGFAIDTGTAAQRRPPDQMADPMTDHAPIPASALRADDAATDRAHALALRDFYARAGFLIRRAHQVVVASFIDGMGAVRLTPTQFAALVVICDQPEIDQINLARRLGIDRTNASMVVNGLTQNGWVHCARAPQDARRNVLTATRAGEASMVLARNIAIEHGAKLGSLMGTVQLAELCTLLRKLLASLPSTAPEWQRPDGSSDLEDLSPIARDYPGHAALYDAIGFLIRRAQQVVEAVFLDNTPVAGLTPRRAGLLYVTSVLEPVEQLTLARWLALDNSTMASVVGDLVRKGLIARSLHPTDKRRRLLQLSPEGRDVLELLTPAANSTSRQITATLGEDGPRFITLMQQFLLATQDLHRVAIHPAVTEMHREIYGK